jgi:uncharacterized membrane protein YhaH (DUF805 family)
MKRTTKQLYRNIGISIGVILLCIYALTQLTGMKFLDNTQTWVVNGTVIICLLVFIFYLRLLVKELRRVRSEAS